MTLDSTLDRIEGDLTAAVAGHRRRARLRLRALAAGTVAVVLVSLGLTITGRVGTAPARALTITPGDHSLTVRVQDAGAHAAEMTRQLQAAGANVVVQAEPASPDAIGHWLAFGTLGKATPEQSMALVRDLAKQLHEHSDYVSIPTDTPFRMLLVVGREARPGEQPCTSPGGVIVTLDGSSCESAQQAGRAPSR
jgi:hypothetical protein